jgi:hypothetical protein
MIDWQPLLEGRTNGSGIAVGGVRVGDSLDALPRENTQLNPQSPSEQRGSRNGEVFDITEDDRWVPVPRDVLLAELRQYGGHVYAGQVTYVVADGRIRQIWVRGTVLCHLPFATEADIEHWLGPASGIERTHGWIIRHYPERHLSVAWHDKENRLQHVALGPVDWVPPTFGAKEVLREWLAAGYSGLAPGWKEPEDRASSQWVQHARVTALLRAFALGSPEDFAEGRFLEEKPLSAYPRATEALGWYLKESPGRDRPDTLSRLFSWLLTYRLKAEHLLSLNSGWLSASSPGIVTALRVTGRANAGVEAALAEVNALIEELIAPEGKRVTERELIERWGWPEVDLDQLRIEEL